MSNSKENGVDGTSMPEAVVEKKTGFSVVWVVPIVAIIIAAGLVYKTIMEQGPVITISFKSAEGLEAGKTKIKHKDVVVGQVEEIKVSPDLSKVIVTAELVREAKKYLTDDTRFWVVRPRFAGGVATGLSTLFSGAYIAVDPSLEGKTSHRFQGLEIPPVVTADTPGGHFKLKAPHLGSIDYGSPIYFRGVKVGQVEGYRFVEEDEGLEIEIFIEAPFNLHVFEETRFWFASGFDMVLDAKGMRINTQSFASMVVGGIVFTNPDRMDKGAQAAEAHVFSVHDSREEALAPKFYEKDYYLLKFDDSVRGLEIGAPVEFRGFPFGHVVDIGLEIRWEEGLPRIPVKIEVEPERIKLLTKNDQAPENPVQYLVRQGLRGQLRTGNLLTGGKYVAIDIFEGQDPAELIMHGNLAEIPTISSPISDAAKNLSVFLEGLSKLPVEEIGASTLETVQHIKEITKDLETAGSEVAGIMTSQSVQNAVASMDELLERLNRMAGELETDLPDAVNGVSDQVVETMADVQSLVSPESALVFELRQTLNEIAKMARQISRLADQLERHPESLIQGKGRE